MKNKTGRHQRCTALEIVEVVRQMAGQFSDEQIATTLNRLGLRTGAGKTWNKNRVASLRHYQQWPSYDVQRQARLSYLGGSRPASATKFHHCKTDDQAEVVTRKSGCRICAVADCNDRVSHRWTLSALCKEANNRAYVPRTLQVEEQHSLFSKS